MTYKYFFIFLFLVSFCSAQIIVEQDKIPLNRISDKLQSPVSLEIHPLGLILIGDNQLQTVMAFNDKEKKVVYTSASSGRIPLMNPVSISSNPLYTLILDLDNQTINRFDNKLRPVSQLSEDALFPFSDGNRIIYIQIDNQHNFYLLEENEYQIIKIDPEGNLLDKFGGKRSSSLEFREIYKFEPLGKNGFITYDYLLNQLIGFTLFGQKIYSISLSSVPLDFSGNFDQNWIILDEDRSILIGKNNRIIGKERLPDLIHEEIIEIAMHPTKPEFWILTSNFLYKFEIYNKIDE